MAANAVLKPVREAGWRSGFGNLLRKELGLWFGTSRWWKQAALWTLILNGVVVMIMLAMRSESPEGMPPMGPFMVAVEVFFKFAAIATAVGAVLSIQDAIIGERQSGTAAWILSKPVSRPSFVVTKFLAHAVGMTILAILLQTVIFVVQTWFWSDGSLPEALPLLQALGLLVMNILFYQSLCLMLSTFFHGRGAVTGTALGLLFAGQALPNFLPWTLKVMPWIISDLAPAAILKAQAPDWSWIPLTITALAIPVFLGVALWRFQREEL
ncbi:MAG TPA: ABC transporter permease subunit [Symbiobacteriaceae bacterium]|nr:ABC transporter permease subunit [Symbiobacteriaceae bacterium]